MEIILLLILFAMIPLAMLAGIIKFIIWLVRKYRNRNNPTEQVIEKPVRKFSGSEIMLIIGTLFIVLSGIAFGCAGWVNTSPSGRVAIMTMAVVMMSIAGEVFRRIIKLDRTATAFEIISTILTAITVITAGFYGLLGNWLSYQGMNVLFAISSAITGLTSFIHGKLSGNKVFKYSTYLSVTATIIFLSSQVKNDSLFALMMLFMQMLFTAVYVFIGIKDDIMKNSVKISGVVFALCSLYYAVDKMFVPDATSYVVMLVTWIQLVFYGVYLKKSSLKSLQSILSIFITFVFVDNMEYGDKQVIIASMIFTLIYIANRFIPHIRNTFSEVLTLGFATYISIVSTTLDNPYALIIPFVVSGLIMSYTFTGNKFVQIVAGIGSPILPLIITFSTYEYEWFVIIISLVTFIIMRYTERKTDIVLYANMFVSGGIIFLWALDCPERIFMIPLACGVHIAVSCMLKNNVTGILSALSFITVTAELEMSDYKILVFFCCLMVLAKIFYRENLLVRNIGTKKYDIITFSAWITFFTADSAFVFLMITAVYSACLVRRKNKTLTADILLSVSAFFTMLAMINRPFFVPSYSMIDNKITLAIIAFMGIAYRIIWKNSPKLSKIFSNIIFILAFSGLTYDIMDYHRLGNTIFGLAVIAFILIISFSTKSRTWFGASSVSLVTITVWASIRYLGKADWWVYLFVVGITFIAVAGVSEYLKTKDKRISEIFSDWKW